MLKVYAERRAGEYNINLWGHADSAPHGHDLVCAAASMLVHALVAMVVACRVDDHEIRLKAGNTKIAVIDNSPAMDTAFMQTVLGFGLLSRQYPQHVKLTTYGFFEEEDR